MIYALGGGWGHLTRALALGRIAALYCSVKIVTNSPYFFYLQDKLEVGCQVEAISADAGLSATCDRVQEVLQDCYSCLIVDTFPRGLGGELAEVLPHLTIPRILIHRDITPSYVRVKSLHSFVLQHFDVVVVPGEGKDLPLADLPIVKHTAPWLIRSATELPDLMQARILLKLPNTSPFASTIVVCAAGRTSELEFFAEVAIALTSNFPTTAVRLLSPRCPRGFPASLWISHWPGIECLRAANIVVGGAGYNLVAECTALGIPLVAFALPRLYDRQEQRACQRCYWVRSLGEALATVGKLLNCGQTGVPNPVTYVNGAVEAQAIVAQVQPLI